MPRGSMTERPLSYSQMTPDPIGNKDNNKPDGNKGKTKNSASWTYTMHPHNAPLARNTTNPPQTQIVGTRMDHQLGTVLLSVAHPRHDHRDMLDLCPTTRMFSSSGIPILRSDGVQFVNMKSQA